MNDNENIQLEPEETEAAATVVETHRNPSWIRNKWLLRVGGFMLIVAIVAGGLWLWSSYGHTKNATRPVFTIDGVSFSQPTISSIIAEPVRGGTNKSDAAKQAFNMYKVEAAAKKLGLKLTNPDIDTARKLRFPATESVAKLTAWQLLVARYQAFNTKMEATNSQFPDVTATGYVYIFYFGNLIQTAPDYMPANHGNKTLIAEDQAYAKQQADKYHELLANKTITPEQALKETTANTRLSYHNLVDASMSKKIGGDATQFSFIAMTDAKKAAYAAADKVGLSSVKVGHSSAGKADTYYYMIFIDKAGASSGWEKLQKATETIQADYKGLN